MKLVTTSQLYKVTNDILLSIVLLYIIFFTSTCASIRPLEGGPKDTTPPQLVSTSPVHESLNNFKNDKRNPVIRLTFDKEIEVQDIYNRLIITPKLPPLEDRMSYTCKVRKNELELKLDVPLEENTTYTFNFKKGAICDTYESTPAENTILTFSTGPQLDDMHIKGKVQELMTNRPVGGTLVTLYKLEEAEGASESGEDKEKGAVHILNTNPDYFTESQEDGTFVLEHIKEGNYRICAGKSNEEKLTIDPSQEMYGFVAKPIALTQPIEDMVIKILKADNSKLQVQSHRPHGPYCEITFSKPIKRYQLAFKYITKGLKRRKATTLYSQLVDNNTTIRVYNTFGLLDDDRLAATLEAEDEVGNTIQEDIDLVFKNNKTAIESLTYTIHPKDNAPIHPERFHTTFTFNQPIKQVRTDKLTLKTTAAATLHITQADVSLQNNVVTITKDIAGIPTEKDASITLEVDAGAFISVDKESNKAKTLTYKFQNLAEASSISGTVFVKYAPGFIIQLLDDTYNVIAERKNETSYAFTELLPGTYHIRILVTSASGKWFYGDINTFTPPNPVIFYPAPLQLIANWDFEDIDFNL